MAGRFTAVPVMTAICTVLLMAGCRSSWRPTVEALRSADGISVDLWSRSAPVGAKLTFRETNLLDESAAGRTYPMHLGEGGLIAGELKPVDRFDLSPFVRSDGEQPPRFQWPNMKDRSAKGFLLEFDPPLLDRPPVLAGDETQKAKSSFVYHNWEGKQIARGTATRTFKLEGYENLEVGDTSYPDCVLLRVETLLIVPFVARVEVIEYRWLAPKVGEVQRVLHVDGMVLLRPIKSGTQYELARAELPESRPATGGTQRKEPGAAWRRCAVYLEPSIPRPQVRGLVVEFAPYEVLDEQ